MSDLSALAQAIHANLSTILAEARKAEAKAANLPQCEADVAALLDALAAAEEDCRGHFDRFPRDGYEDRYEEDPECKADWSRACEARQVAIANLTRFAMARREAALKAA